MKYIHKIEVHKTHHVIYLGWVGVILPASVLAGPAGPNNTDKASAEYENR